MPDVFGGPIKQPAKATPAPPASWWANPAFLDDREAFYLRASIEADRLRMTGTVSVWASDCGRFGDYWRKPKTEPYADPDTSTRMTALLTNDDDGERAA